MFCFFLYFMFLISQLSKDIWGSCFRTLSLLSFSASNTCRDSFGRSVKQRWPRNWVVAPRFLAAYRAGVENGLYRQRIQKGFAVFLEGGEILMVAVGMAACVLLCLRTGEKVSYPLRLFVRGSRNSQDSIFSRIPIAACSLVMWRRPLPLKKNVIPQIRVQGSSMVFSFNISFSYTLFYPT